MTMKHNMLHLGKYFYIGLEKSKPTTCIDDACDTESLVWDDGSVFVFDGSATTASGAGLRAFRTKDAAGITDVDYSTDSSVLCSANCHASKYNTM